jgi:hypothetical protein
MSHVLGRHGRDPLTPETEADRSGQGRKVLRSSKLLIWTVSGQSLRRITRRRDWRSRECIPRLRVCAASVHDELDPPAGFRARQPARHHTRFVGIPRTPDR